MAHSTQSRRDARTQHTDTHSAEKNSGHPWSLDRGAARIGSPSRPGTRSWAHGKVLEMQRIDRMVRAPLLLLLLVVHTGDPVRLSSHSSMRSSHRPGSHGSHLCHQEGLIIASGARR